MTELNGFRVLVTGATSGLGAAMAAALAESDARVMVTGRDQARTEATARELGPSAIPCRLDVRDRGPMANQVQPGGGSSWFVGGVFRIGG
jgi:NADP-dependent 3-hydroxy acid dehydrogenase YdfG